MSSKHIQSMNECSDIDQLIVNAAISRGMTSLNHCVHIGHKFW